MKTSKYAPKTPAESLAQSKAEKLKQDKNRITRLLGRVRWKAEMLMVSYLRTLEIVQHASHNNNNGPSSPHAMGSGASSTQAESMFKVDFFEFYTLLERYMLSCLSIFGISVSSSLLPSQQPRQNFNALRYETNPDLHRTRPMASHAFHANLLEALDDAEGPLAGSLGLQEVRVQLGLAKEYRNAWKDADVDAEGGKKRGEGESRNLVRLEELQLEGMLRNIIAGCELAHQTVQGFELEGNGNGVTSRDFEPRSYGYSMEVEEDMPFEYMEDAMDLD